MSAIAQAKKVLQKQIFSSKQRKYDSGCECLFYKISKTIGLKVYSNKDSRDQAFLVQRLYAKKGLAPKTKGKLNIYMPISLALPDCDFIDAESIAEGFYGYLTEIAKPVGLILDGNDISDKCEYWDDYSRMMKKIRRSGLPVPNDLHSENVAYLQGNLVLIDFGPISVTPKMKKLLKK